MNDCPNADVRDLLPDLAHGRLEADARLMVERHVAGCVDCAAELVLLRDLRATLRRTPVLDLAAISAAVPAYHVPARRSWVGWKAAAAITMIVAGGSSLLVIRDNVSVGLDSVAVGRAPVQGTEPAVAVVPPTESSPAATSSRPLAPAAATPRAGGTALGTTPEGRELAMADGSLGDLTDGELADLLKDIESLDALPRVDVEQAVVSISPRRAP